MAAGRRTLTRSPRPYGCGPADCFSDYLPPGVSAWQYPRHMVLVSAIISAIVAFIVAVLVPLLNSRRLHQAWVREQLAERTDAFYTVAQDVDRISKIEATKPSEYFTTSLGQVDLEELSSNLYYAVDRLKLYASQSLSDKADALAAQLTRYDEVRNAVAVGMGKTRMG